MLFFIFVRNEIYKIEQYSPMEIISHTEDYILKIIKQCLFSFV